MSGQLLYIVATPIGNLGDFSMRGIETLKQVDYILCEDTRVATKLLSSIGVRKKLLIYNDYNAESVIPRVISDMCKGTVFAQVSDAGTPLISDPGYKLIQACIKHKIGYTAIPGACAAINALILSGLPTDKFLFAGFAEHVNFDSIKNIETTIILYEAPTKLINTLSKMAQIFKDRQIAVIREMTKIYEEIIRGTIDEVMSHFCKTPPKGEFVIVIEPPQKHFEKILEQYRELINAMIPLMTPSKISKILSKVTGLSKNFLYNYIKSMGNQHL